MRAIKTTAISMLAIGLAAGSAVGVAGQEEEPSATPRSDDAALSTVPYEAEGGEVRIIELEANQVPPSDEWPYALSSFIQDGVRVEEIAVTPGETVVFRIDNTHDHRHNFYIGTDEELALRDATTEVGIPEWTGGVQEVEWTVPDDITGLRFGCTIPGHYAQMQGAFSLEPTAD